MLSNSNVNNTSRTTVKNTKNQRNNDLMKIEMKEGMQTSSSSPLFHSNPQESEQNNISTIDDNRDSSLSPKRRRREDDFVEQSVPLLHICTTPNDKGHPPSCNQQQQQQKHKSQHSLLKIPPLCMRNGNSNSNRNNIMQFDTIALKRSASFDDNEYSTGMSLKKNNSFDDNEAEDPILEVLNYIDEVDAHAYEDLVPLEVKLALEERLFGWSHLFSVILGHAGFTIIAYALTYTILTNIFHYYNTTTSFTIVPDDVTIGSATFSGPSTGVSDGTSLATSSFHYSSNAMDPIWFQMIRFIISFGMAWSTYGMVRRRSFVWLRAPYGSKAYQQDEKRRRKSIHETDRKTLLGCIISRTHEIKHRRNKKHLLKAQANFDKRQQQQIQQQKQQLREIEQTTPQKVLRFKMSRSDTTDSSDEALVSDNDEDDASDASFLSQDDDDECDNKSRTSFHTEPTNRMESIMHDQILFKDGPIKNMPYSHGGFFGAAPFMLANAYWISIVRRLMPDVYVEISRRVAYAPASKLIHWAENNPVVAAYGTAHELDYHGDEEDEDEEDDDADNNDNDEKKKSNNKSAFNKKGPSNLEWDVFLDPYLVKRVERVLYERDKFIISTTSGRDADGVKDNVDDEDSDSSDSDSGNSENDNFKIQNINSSSPKSSWSVSSSVSSASKLLSERQQLEKSQIHIAKYYDIELQKRVRLLVDKMLIAHGNLTQLVLEQTGYFKRYNYSRVERTRCTLGGGIFARQWMAVYAEALRLGVLEDEALDDYFFDDDDLDITDNGFMNYHHDQSHHYQSQYNNTHNHYQNQHIRRSTSHNNYRKVNAFTAFSKCPNTTIAESVAIVKSITKRESPVGLVLDVKSRHVPKRVWACVIDMLRSAGVRVEAFSSFTIDEIRDVSRFCKEPVNEIVFFHSAGDIQVACHNGKIREGDKVFFNAGSLLWEGMQLYSAFKEGRLLESRLVQQLKFLVDSFWTGFDPNDTKKNYRILPFAKSRRRRKLSSSSENKSTTNDETTAIVASDVIANNENKADNEVNDKFIVDDWYEGSTIEEYKERYKLSIGLYCQEFAVDDVAINLIVQLVNENPHLYDLGLSWGGVNGISIRGIQPGRFTSTDGYWNQRYVGALWDSEKKPPLPSLSTIKMN